MMHCLPGHMWDPNCESALLRSRVAFNGGTHRRGHATRWLHLKLRIWLTGWKESSGAFHSKWESLLVPVSFFLCLAMLHDSQ